MKDICVLVGLGTSCESNGSDCEFLSIEVVLCALKRLSSSRKGVIAEIEEFLALCFDFLRVRLSSRGFISGGSLVIFLKMTIRYMSMKPEIR